MPRHRPCGEVLHATSTVTRKAPQCQAVARVPEHTDGAGIDLLNAGGVGLRVSVQDAFNVARYGIDCARYGFNQATCDGGGGGIRTNVQHEPSLQIGFSWR
jgi:hypothetical protein